MASPASISEAQLIANRENAQHSTGPRTPEGRSRTRLNGLRHGLTGQTVLLPEDDRAAYDLHCAGLLTEFAPAGAIETQIAQSVAGDYWRLNRIKAIEDNIFALGIEAHAGEFHEDPVSDAALAQAQTFLDNAHQINLLSVYEQRINRGIAKKLVELAELQRIRKVDDRRSGLIPNSSEAQRSASGGGSGFSTNNFQVPVVQEQYREMPKSSNSAPDSARAA